MSVKPVCVCIDIDCSVCFDMSIDYCPVSPINLNVGQTPTTQIYLWIIDKLGNVYNDLVTVKNDGSIDIDLSHFQIGMFTPNFGAIDIFLTSDSAGKIVLPISTLYPSSVYNCIFLKVNEEVHIINPDCRN